LNSYAGPEFQKVQEVWTSGFTQTYMVSNRDIIVASVDGRGSAYEGEWLCMNDEQNTACSNIRKNWQVITHNRLVSLRKNVENM